MKILRSYCLRELNQPFLLSLSLFTFIFMVGNLVKLADLLVNKGVGIIDIIKMLFLLMPQLVIFILPTSAIAAVLLVFGGFAQNNEINAMKASGVNVWRVMAPVAVVAFLLSILTLFFTDQIQPRLHELYRDTMNDLMIKKPEAYLESGRFVKDFKGYTIWVKKVDGRKLEGVTIFQDQQGAPTRTIIAEWGEIISNPKEGALGLRLHNGVSDEPNPENPAVLYKMNFETFTLPAMNLSEGDSVKKAKKKMKDLSLNELLYTLKSMKMRREELQKDEWRSDEDIAKEVRDVTLQAKAEIQRKISFSFATFCFVMIGLPLAIVTRRGEAVVSFVFSMLIVAVYYILSIWSKSMAVNGVLPAIISMWLPNVILIGTAAFLMTKVVRL